MEEVCERIFAGGDKPKEFSKFKTEKFTIPIYANGEKNKGLYGYTDEAKVLEPSITISGRGTIGYSEIRNEPFTPIVRLIVLKPKKEDVDIKFLKNVVSNLDFINSGSSIPQLTVPMVKGYTFSLPPLTQQKHIVAILDKAFASIDTAKANAEQNLQNAKELFDSYLQNIFENKGDDWGEKKIIEICRLVNGKAYKKKELLDDGKYRVLRVGNLFTSKHWYYSDLELAEDKYIDSGDLIYAWSASFGPRTWTEEKVIYHYHIWKVIPDYELVTKEFLYVLFEWDKEKIKKAEGTGTTMIHVGKGSMEQREILLPPIKEQKIIVQKLDTLSLKTKKLEAIYTQKIADLDEMKKSVLQKAFSGQLSSLN